MFGSRMALLIDIVVGQLKHFSVPVGICMIGITWENLERFPRRIYFLCYTNEATREGRSSRSCQLRDHKCNTLAYYTACCILH